MKVTAQEKFIVGEVYGPENLLTRKVYHLGKFIEKVYRPENLHSKKFTIQKSYQPRKSYWLIKFTDKESLLLENLLSRKVNGQESLHSKKFTVQKS